jgi:hypothetical protein
MPSFEQRRYWKGISRPYLSLTKRRRAATCTRSLPPFPAVLAEKLHELHRLVRTIGQPELC